jgi:signal transduction histidine kinase
LLASLPVRLLPGQAPPVQVAGLSPTHQSRLIAWAAMLVGALAVAALLHGVMALSERRASFVSAVTHELRTPLTTFRMYAEMLAEGMVADEESRRRYLGTLRVEADRLTHLVENVLAYARLERGGTSGRIAPVSVATMLHEGSDRLAGRAEQAGLQLLIDADENTLVASALADVAAVEQILFNLVDNACKYAAAARDRSLHVEAEADARHVRLRVRDHGLGVSIDQRGRLFQPFRKSADEAARSAPGVGLGLALSRRLARQMGGDLSYQPNGEPGASFVLTLRRVTAES